MDFDNDGLLDIVSGSYSPGEIFVFRKQSDGTYAKPEKILDKTSRPVVVGPAATAYLADWDADDDLDLIIGNISGEVWLVPNEGTRETPAYGQKQQLKSDSGKINVGHDAGPIVADWDADGRRDLIVGSGDGSVLLFRNTSDDKTRPVLAAAQTLVPPVQRAAAPDANDVASLRGMRAKPHVVDYNGDGKLDLLVGDFSSISVPQEVPPEVRQKQQQLEEKLAALTKQWETLRDAPAGETPEQRRDRLKQRRDLQRQINEQRIEALQIQPQARGRRQTHGYVWLYLRQDAAKSARAQGGGGG